MGARECQEARHLAQTLGTPSRRQTLFPLHFMSPRYTRSLQLYQIYRNSIEVEWIQYDFVSESLNTIFTLNLIWCW